MLLALTATSAGLQARAVVARHGRPSADERAYLRLARDLALRGRWGDRGLKQPFRWAPGTPMVFAAASAASGRPVDRGLADGVQLALGALIVPLTAWLAALLAGRAAGLVAGGAIAAYLPLARATATAGSETLGALMVLLAGVAVCGALCRQRKRHFVAAGAVLGLAVLARGDLAAVAVLLPAGVALLAGRAARDARRGLAVGSAMLAAVLATILPWSVLASLRARHLVPVTDGGAANLFIGTDLPAHGSIFGVKSQFATATFAMHPRLRRRSAATLHEQLVLDAVAARYPGRSRDAALRAAALHNLRRYALGRPAAFAGMELSKLWRMWGGAYGGTLHGPGTPATVEHRLLAALATLALAAGIWATRDPRLVLLAAFIAVTSATDVAFVAEARHNVRLMPLLSAAGAAGASLSAAHVRRRRDRADRPASDA